MKKFAPVAILLLFCLLAWNVFVHPFGMTFDIYGTDIHGTDMHGMDIHGASFDNPLGAVLGALFAGGALFIATGALLLAAALLALVFAGVGVLLVCALSLGALALAALVSPLLLPLLIPAAIVWLFVARARRHRRAAQAP